MSSSEPLVLFRRVSVRLGRSGLQEFARILQRRVAGGREFCCLVTDDRALRRLNAEFRRKNHATDVLSFPSNGGTPAGHSLGDIAISAERAAEQAEQFGHSAEDEIRILMLHGVLHLVGMDHERDGGRMARRESGWRRKLGLPAGLIERVRG
jgi:probable rRNA maturation factor